MTVKILTGQSVFVNDCTFLQSCEGQLLASVGGNLHFVYEHASSGDLVVGLASE